MAWAMVRHRFASFAGTFVAIALGVAVVAGSATLYLSSRPQPPARYAASPVLVQAPSVGTDDYGNPELRSWSSVEAAELADELAEVPGVAAAVPDPVFYVQERDAKDDGTARLAGHAWSSAMLGGYRLTAGRAPQGPGEVVADRPVGGSLDVLTAVGPETWTVTGTTDGPGFYLADDDAATRASGIRAIGLITTGEADAGLTPGRNAANEAGQTAGDEPGRVADAAQARIGAGGTVLAGRERSALEPESTTRIRWLGAQLLIALVTLGSFATVFVVASTCALAAAQRQRELGLLRAAGATPGQVRRLMYAETALIALLGGIAGAPLGVVTAPLPAGPMIDFGLEPPGFAVTWQPAAAGGAILLGLVVAMAGVTVPARRASRVAPLAALQAATVESRTMTPARWAFGLLSATGGAVLLLIVPGMPRQSMTTAGMGAAMMLLTAATLLAPVMIGPLVRLVTLPWRGSATGMMVRESTLIGVRRVASTAAPVLLTVGITVLLTGTIATAEQAAGVDGTAEIPAVTVLAPDGTPGLSEAAVHGQPGDARLGTRVLITYGSATTGYDATGVAGALVTLSRQAARDLGASTGSVLTVGWPDGADTPFVVDGVDPDATFPLVLPRDLVRSHDPDALTELVTLTGDAMPADGARVLTAREYVQEDLDEEGRLVDLFLGVLIGLTAGYTAIAVSNTLLMATAARLPEFRALRLAGAGRGQVLRVTTAEALLVTATGALLGGTVGVYSLTGVRASVEGEVGHDVTLIVPWQAGLAVAALCAVLAVTAAAAPILRRRIS
ncbi:ABC transporter permease [Actinoplanes sp. NPDC051851]|uniref:ABC transporter permease n=1 Tax=Actinoplanes sp. NPDC051851 TaxID=3154753 RepID=UPI0034174119